jgi:DNA polymerase-3 subunit alpha (Gram-positive type)
VVNYVTFDLETTGFSPETCDIIEIGAWKVKDGAVVDKFSQLIRPIMYIPRNIQNLTGITMEDVADCDTIDTVLMEFFDWCEDLPLLGYNLPFDYKFICYKGKFLGVDFSLKNTRQGIDVLNLAKKYITAENHKLRTVAEKLEISTDDSNSEYHRASFDAYITKLIYDRLLFSNPKNFEIVNPSSLGDKDGRYGKVTNNDTLSFN